MKETIEAARNAAKETEKLREVLGIIPDPIIVSLYYSGHGASVNGKFFAVVPGRPFEDWIDLTKFVSDCACRANI